MQHKYAHLDSLRWIAAFAVGMCHTFHCFYIDQTTLKPLHGLGTAIFNGAYAVDFFFVLSGFVLVNATTSLSLAFYLGFVIRRVLRIYPAAWVSLIVSATAVALAQTAYGQPWMADWVIGLLTWPSGTLGAGISEALLYTHRLNPILWSIAIEMMASVLYPLMIAVMRWSVPLYMGLAMAAVIASAFVPATYDPASFGHFLYMFMIGAALNLVPPNFVSRKQGGYLLALAGLLMLLARPFASNATVSDLISTFSAATIIAVVAFACPRPFEAWFGNKKLLLLGRCSYSYYLLNPAILFLLVRWYPAIGLAAPVSRLGYIVYVLTFGIITAVGTVVSAHLLAITVERFSIRAGRKAERMIITGMADWRRSAVHVVPPT
jgi:peptidoglycan/LPS O-acetylase OafA/YrhL